MRYCSLILVFFCLSIIAQPQTILAEWKVDKDLKYANYAWCAIEIASGKIIAQHNAEQLLIPASTQKIFTTATALAKLGPDYKYETKLVYTGTFDKNSGLLKGDLLIVGSGDPSLQSSFSTKTSLVALWAETLYNLGLRRIEGAVIADASAYSRPVNSTWLYEDISNYYGASPCAINYVDNKFTLSFQTGAAGSTATLSHVSPNYKSTPYVFTHSIIASGTRDEAYIYGDPNEFKRSIFGSLPANKTNYEVEGVLPDPALLCAQQFQDALLKKGISSSSEAKASYQQLPPLKRSVLYTHLSPSMTQLAQVTNQYSNNLYCEALRYTLGKGDGTKGIQTIKTYCADLGIDTTGLLMEDACGLSRLNACSAGTQAQFLSAVKKQSKIASPFYNSLSTSGKSGSLATFGKGTALENNLTAKSGFVTRARAYCGYLTTKTGKEIAFSVIVNNFTCSGKAMKPKLEKFILSLNAL